MKKSKELFTVLGEAKIVEGRKRFVANSMGHLKACMSRLPMNKEISCTFSEHVATRSETQLAYHFVLLKYISDYNGNTVEELHDGIMKLKFGTKKIKIGDQVVEVRKSVSKSAYIPKDKMGELIDFDLEICKKLNIKVPTREELGYGPTSYSWQRPLTPVYKEKK